MRPALYVPCPECAVWSANTAIVRAVMQPTEPSHGALPNHARRSHVLWWWASVPGRHVPTRGCPSARHSCVPLHVHPVARKVQSKEGLEHEQVLRVEHAEDDEEPSGGRSVYNHVEDSAVLRGCTVV